VQKSTHGDALLSVNFDLSVMENGMPFEWFTESLFDLRCHITATPGLAGAPRNSLVFTVEPGHGCPKPVQRAQPDQIFLPTMRVATTFLTEQMQGGSKVLDQSHERLAYMLRQIAALCWNKAFPVNPALEQWPDTDTDTDNLLLRGLAPSAVVVEDLDFNDVDGADFDHVKRVDATFAFTIQGVVQVSTHDESAVFPSSARMLLEKSDTWKSEIEAYFKEWNTREDILTTFTFSEVIVEESGQNALHETLWRDISDDLSEKFVHLVEMSALTGFSIKRGPHLDHFQDTFVLTPASGGVSCRCPQNASVAENSHVSIDFRAEITATQLQEVSASKPECLLAWEASFIAMMSHGTRNLTPTDKDTWNPSKWHVEILLPIDGGNVFDVRVQRATDHLTDFSVRLIKEKIAWRIPTRDDMDNQILSTLQVLNSAELTAVPSPKPAFVATMKLRLHSAGPTLEFATGPGGVSGVEWGCEAVVATLLRETPYRHLYTEVIVTDGNEQMNVDGDMQSFVDIEIRIGELGTPPRADYAIKVRDDVLLPLARRVIGSPTSTAVPHPLRTADDIGRVEVLEQQPKVIDESLRDNPALMMSGELNVTAEDQNVSTVEEATQTWLSRSLSTYVSGLLESQAAAWRISVLNLATSSNIDGADTFVITFFVSVTGLPNTSTAQTVADWMQASSGLAAVAAGPGIHFDAVKVRSEGVRGSDPPSPTINAALMAQKGLRVSICMNLCGARAVGTRLSTGLNEWIKTETHSEFTFPDVLLTVSRVASSNMRVCATLFFNDVRLAGVPYDKLTAMKSVDILKKVTAVDPWAGVTSVEIEDEITASWPLLDSNDRVVITACSTERLVGSKIGDLATAIEEGVHSVGVHRAMVSVSQQSAPTCANHVIIGVSFLKNLRYSDMIVQMWPKGYEIGNTKVEVESIRSDQQHSETTPSEGLLTTRLALSCQGCSERSLDVGPVPSRKIEATVRAQVDQVLGSTSTDLIWEHGPDGRDVITVHVPSQTAAEAVATRQTILMHVDVLLSSVRKASSDVEVAMNLDSVTVGAFSLDGESRISFVVQTSVCEEQVVPMRLWEVRQHACEIAAESAGIPPEQLWRVGLTSSNSPSHDSSCWDVSASCVLGPISGSEWDPRFSLHLQRRLESGVGKSTFTAPVSSGNVTFSELVISQVVLSYPLVASSSPTDLHDLLRRRPSVEAKFVITGAKILSRSNQTGISGAIASVSGWGPSMLGITAVMTTRSPPEGSCMNDYPAWGACGTSWTSIDDVDDAQEVEIAVTFLAEDTLACDFCDFHEKVLELHQRLTEAADSLMASNLTFVSLSPPRTPLFTNYPSIAAATRLCGKSGTNAERFYSHKTQSQLACAIAEVGSAGERPPGTCLLRKNWAHAYQVRFLDIAVDRECAEIKFHVDMFHESTAEATAWRAKRFATNIRTYLGDPRSWVNSPSSDSGFRGITDVFEADSQKLVSWPISAPFVTSTVRLTTGSSVLNTSDALDVLSETQNCPGGPSGIAVISISVQSSGTFVDLGLFQGDKSSLWERFDALERLGEVITECRQLSWPVTATVTSGPSIGDVWTSHSPTLTIELHGWAFEGDLCSSPKADVQRRVSEHVSESLSIRSSHLVNAAVTCGDDDTEYTVRAMVTHLGSWGKVWGLSYTIRDTPDLVKGRPIVVGDGTDLLSGAELTPEIPHVSLSLQLKGSRLCPWTTSEEHALTAALQAVVGRAIMASFMHSEELSCLADGYTEDSVATTMNIIPRDVDGHPSLASLRAQLVELLSSPLSVAQVQHLLPGVEKIITLTWPTFVHHVPIAVSDDMGMFVAVELTSVGGFDTDIDAGMEALLEWAAEFLAVDQNKIDVRWNRERLYLHASPLRLPAAKSAARKLWQVSESGRTVDVGGLSLTVSPNSIYPHPDIAAPDSNLIEVSVGLRLDLLYRRSWADSSMLAHLILQRWFCEAVGVIECRLSALSIDSMHQHLTLAVYNLHEGSKILDVRRRVASSLLQLPDWNTVVWPVHGIKILEASATAPTARVRPSSNPDLLEIGGDSDASSVHIVSFRLFGVGKLSPLALEDLYAQTWARLDVSLRRGAQQWQVQSSVTGNSDIKHGQCVFGDNDNGFVRLSLKLDHAASGLVEAAADVRSRSAESSLFETEPSCGFVRVLEEMAQAAGYLAVVPDDVSSTIATGCYLGHLALDSDPGQPVLMTMLVSASQQSVGENNQFSTAWFSLQHAIATAKGMLPSQIKILATQMLDHLAVDPPRPSTVFMAQVMVSASPDEMAGRPLAELAIADEYRNCGINGYTIHASKWGRIRDQKVLGTYILPNFVAPAAPLKCFKNALNAVSPDIDVGWQEPISLVKGISYITLAAGFSPPNLTDSVVASMSETNCSLQPVGLPLATPGPNSAVSSVSLVVESWNTEAEDPRYFEAALRSMIHRLASPHEGFVQVSWRSDYEMVAVIRIPQCMSCGASTRALFMTLTDVLGADEGESGGLYPASGLPATSILAKSIYFIPSRIAPLAKSLQMNSLTKEIRQLYATIDVIVFMLCQEECRDHLSASEKDAVAAFLVQETQLIEYWMVGVKPHGAQEQGGVSFSCTITALSDLEHAHNLSVALERLAHRAFPLAELGISGRATDSMEVRRVLSFPSTEGGIDSTLELHLHVSIEYALQWIEKDDLTAEISIQEALSFALGLHPAHVIVTEQSAPPRSLMNVLQDSSWGRFTARIVFLDTSQSAEVSLKVIEELEVVLRDVRTFLENRGVSVVDVKISKSAVQTTFSDK